jgi:hypothetical protein
VSNRDIVALQLLLTRIHISFKWCFPKYFYLNTVTAQKLTESSSERRHKNLIINYLGGIDIQMGKDKKREMERSIIVKSFGNIEINALNALAHNCAKLIVKEFSAKIVSGDFEMPSNSAMEEMINKELEWDFDEDKVAAEIKRNYPGWSEEQVYDEVDKLGDLYEDERSDHLEPIINATVLECQNMVKELQKRAEA